MTQHQEAVQDIAAFLSPSLATIKDEILLKQLYDAIPPSWADNNRLSLSDDAQVVLYSVDLLKRLHRTCNEDGNQLGIKDWKYVNSIVDIVLVVGLYPTLSPGVGLPANSRIKSPLLQRKETEGSIPENERTRVLELIILSLKVIMEEGGEVGESLQRRHLPDILGGFMELSFNPSRSNVHRTSWEIRYDSFLSRYVIRHS
jgi:hypothetical protein